MQQLIHLSKIFPMKVEDNDALNLNCVSFLYVYFNLNPLLIIHAMMLTNQFHDQFLNAIHSEYWFI